MSVASLISDRFRELGCKSSSLRHTHAVGLDATDTTKILQRSFCWSSFQFCLIYVMAPHATHASCFLTHFVACADLDIYLQECFQPSSVHLCKSTLCFNRVKQPFYHQYNYTFYSMLICTCNTTKTMLSAYMHVWHAVRRVNG